MVISAYFIFLLFILNIFNISYSGEKIHVVPNPFIKSPTEYYQVHVLHSGEKPNNKLANCWGCDSDDIKKLSSETGLIMITP